MKASKDVSNELTREQVEFCLRKTGELSKKILLAHNAAQQARRTHQSSGKVRYQ